MKGLFIDAEKAEVREVVGDAELNPREYLGVSDVECVRLNKREVLMVASRVMEPVRFFKFRGGPQQWIAGSGLVVGIDDNEEFADTVQEPGELESEVVFLSVDDPKLAPRQPMLSGDLVKGLMAELLLGMMKSKNSKSGWR